VLMKINTLFKYLVLWRMLCRDILFSFLLFEEVTLSQ